jgi:FKBP-type peptidyl-prolyl cis-trans isomerase (trigger factor)
MKTEIKKLDATLRELNIEVSGDAVKNKFNDVFIRIGKDAKVPGFRPGHAPRDILEKHYSSTAHEQVVKELVPDIYHEAIHKEGLDVIEYPEISDVKLDRERLSFKAVVEISPEIEVKDYKGVRVDCKTISVSPEDVKRAVDSLKESRKVPAADDSLAKSLGYPKLAELEGALEKQVYLQKDNEERQRIENGLIEHILKDLDFKLPKGLVNRQMQDLLRQAKVNLAMKGVPREKIDEQEGALTKELTPTAEKQVRVYLVLAAIAKKENMPLDDSMPRRVVEFLLKEANWQEAK